MVQQRDLGYPTTDTHLLDDDGEGGMRGGGGRKGMREEADQAAKAAAEAASRKRPRLKEPGTWRETLVFGCGGCGLLFYLHVFSNYILTILFYLHIICLIFFLYRRRISF